MTTPATPGTAQQAERLWVTAHEHVRRGDFAAATRDLSQCFAILQALKDPRVAEVHKRWTEVHKLYQEDGARAAATSTAQKAAPAPTLEAEAEAAANAGNLEQAIQLYEKALQKQPQNELVAERLLELKAARPRAAELSSPGRQAPAATSAPVEVKREVAQVVAAAPAQPVRDPAAEALARAEAAAAEAVARASAVSDGIERDDDIHERATLIPQQASTAHVMKAEDAGVGMQSLDVDVDVGAAVTSSAADELPVSDESDDVAFLEDLLARVQANRRAA